MVQFSVHQLSHYYNQTEAMFFHMYSQVPHAEQPFVPPTLLVIGASLYLWALVLLGRWAEAKGQRFWVGFMLGVVNTPLLGSLFVAFLREGEPRKSRD
jgi:hypothetical protein